MAVEMSPQVLREFGPRRRPLVHLLARAQVLRSASRYVQRRVLGPPLASPSDAEARVLPGFDAAAASFRQQGWTFVDPFFDWEFFAALRAGWPPRRFFAPMKNPLKSYDNGFSWHRNRGPRNVEFLDRFPAFERAYDMFRSQEFAERVTKFCGDGVSRSCFSLKSTWASSGSALIPHRDTNANRMGPGGAINVVVFVDANGKPPYAGGTCILADNEYQRILFEPTKLTNTALIYQLDAEFFHGFKPVARGAFRWAILAQYADIAQKGNLPD